MATAHSRPAFAKTQSIALDELAAIQKQVLRFGESLKKRSAGQLNQRPAEGKWSALECLEHLNRYANHYLPRFDAKLVSTKTRADTKAAYKPGLLGKPFALAMHVSKRGKPMRSPGNMNPLGSTLDADAVVTAFINNMRHYAEIIAALRDKELRGSRIPVSAFPIVRLHLGDMLYTLIWHNERHVEQAQEAL